MNSHRESDKLVCYICGMTYKSKSALDVHVGMHQVCFLSIKIKFNFKFLKKISGSESS